MMRFSRRSTATYAVRWALRPRPPLQAVRWFPRSSRNRCNGSCSRGHVRVRSARSTARTWCVCIGSSRPYLYASCVKRADWRCHAPGQRTARHEPIDARSAGVRDKDQRRNACCSRPVPFHPHPQPTEASVPCRCPLVLPFSFSLRPLCFHAHGEEWPRPRASAR
jgi:hypothetical protein